MWFQTQKGCVIGLGFAAIFLGYVELLRPTWYNKPRGVYLLCMVFCLALQDNLSVSIQERIYSCIRSLQIQLEGKYMKRNHLTLMIKPSSAACNLACDYCFYLEMAKHREVACHPFMQEDVMTCSISKALAEAQGCSFVFQGGEPSLIGLDYYKKFVETVTVLNTENLPIHYAFQTNGTHITDEWAHFFRENNFLVGVSFDGSPRLHDVHRFKKGGEKTSRTVLDGIATLQKQGVAFNILGVVTNELAQNVDLMWNYMIGHGHRYLQFIPCMESLEDPAVKPFLTSENYALFLKRLFDLWFAAWEQGNPISVRFFDNLLGMLVGLPPESCDMAGVCTPNYVVESDGSIYPCDFYCDDAFYMGNILTDSFAQLDARRSELRFLEDSPNKSAACASCPWRTLCRGGCKRYRDGKDQQYRFCSTMLDFYPYVIQRLEYVASMLLREQKQ